MKFKVGLFDSGVGGFTVLKKLLAKRKDLDVIYLADTENSPYGELDFEEIRTIAYQITNWFKDKNLDALLVACNTTNSCALDILQNNLEVPCFDLIESVTDFVSAEKIGILATSATVRSSFYKKSIESKAKGMRVFQQSCPGLVDEIEKIPIDKNKISQLVNPYVQTLLKQNIQQVILGCSHYPLIYDVLRKKIPSRIEIIDPSDALVEKFNHAFLMSENNCYQRFSGSSIQFFVTSGDEEFEEKLGNWLEINEKISLVNLRTDA